MTDDIVRDHPLASAFPLLTGEPFDELVRDIEQNGLREPVMLYEGRILDGRNRYRACRALGIRPRLVRFELLHPDTDPAAYVWSKNAVRRQLTPGQKALAASRLADASAGGFRSLDHVRRTPDDTPETTTAVAARIAGVSVSAVRKAKAVRRKGSVEVIAALERGEIPLKTADELARKTEEEQQEIMAKVPARQLHRMLFSDSPHEDAMTGSFDEEAPPLPTAKRAGPQYTMTDHMIGSKAGIRDVQHVNKFWQEHRDLVKDLDSAHLRTFIRDLEQSREATIRLLRLIEQEIIGEWPTGVARPNLLSTRLNRLDQLRNTPSSPSDDG